MAPTGIEKFAGGAPESQMGSEEVIPEGDDYIIKVRALTFPFLIHELVKGIYEWVAIDPELKKAMQSDTIEKETKDIIVGPELSKILNSYVSVEKQELLPLVYKKFLQLPKSEVKEVFAKSIVGKKVMQDLVFQAEDEWKTFQQEEKEEITSEYQPEE